MGDTKIEWADKTWNPTRGCSRVSAGCVHCYAERQAARFSGKRGMLNEDPPVTDWGPFHGFVQITNGHPQWTGKVELVEKHLEDPLHWRKPCKVFVNSMSDLFHGALPDEAIDRVFAVMALCPQHTFQILTKRPERMLEWFARWTTKRFTYVRRGVTFEAGEWPYPNIWLGVSVEDQKTADERIPLLLQTPAAVRFVSYEPALVPVDFSQYLPILTIGGVEMERWLDWIIVGGESGPGARPAVPEWFRSVRDECQASGTAFFLKQWGQWAPYGDASKHKYRDVPVGDGTHHRMFSVGKKAAGAMLDGREWREFPEVRS